MFPYGLVPHIFTVYYRHLFQTHAVRIPHADSWTMTTTISVRVEFGGGLELLFSNQKSHTVKIPAKTGDDKRSDVKYLIYWLKDNLLREREELFLDGGTV